MTKKKDVGGRPTKKTPEVVKKLCDAFKIDATVEEACWYAGISKVIFYKWYKEDEEFFNEIESAKTFAFIVARKKLMQSMDSENEAIAQRGAIEFLKRRDRRYADRIEGKIDGDVEVSGEVKLDGKTMIELEDMRKKFLGFK